MSNPKVLQKNRLAAFTCQNGRCFYCPARMWEGDKQAFAEKHSISMEEATGFQSTAEHLKAKRDGGTGAGANIVAACEVCNKLRHQLSSARSPQRHKAFVARVAHHYGLVYRLFGENLGPDKSTRGRRSRR